MRLIEWPYNMANSPALGDRLQDPHTYVVLAKPGTGRAHLAVSAAVSRA